MSQVVHLTSGHHASDPRIFRKECKSLAEAGYDVKIIGPDLSDPVRTDGIDFELVEAPRNRWERYFLIPARVFRAARQEKAPLYHFHDPELVPVGVLLSMLGHHVIYDVHEDLPEQVASRRWLPHVIRAQLGYVLGWCQRLLSKLFFDGVVAAVPTIARRFEGNHVVLVRNYPIASDFVEECGRPYGERENVIVYAGGISRNRAIPELVEGVGRLPAEFEVCLKLAGRMSSTDFQKRLEIMSGWSRVEYLGWLDRNEVTRLLVNARIGVVLYYPFRNYADAYPVKLFEYMAAGIPVVAGDLPETRRIVERGECGLLVDPTSPQDIAQGIEMLLRDPTKAEAMGRRGRQAVQKDFNWQREEKKLLALYKAYL